MKREKLYDIYLQCQEFSPPIDFEPLNALWHTATLAHLDLPEWFTSEFTYRADMYYLVGRSGDKYISNYILKTYDFQTKLTPSGTPERSLIEYTLRDVSYTMYYKFMQNWDKLYNAMFADYNPIQNYDSTEEITRSGDDKVSVNTDTKQTSKVSAFNSASLVDNAEVDASGLASNNYSKTDYNSKVKTTKYGNIGVTTSQQMIESEIALREKKFIDLIFDDIDTLFVSNLYFIKD